MTAKEAFDELVPRDRLLIGHAVRYTMTTVPVVKRMHLKDLSEDTVRKVLARLVERGWLVRHALTDRESYYMPSQRTFSALALRRSEKPLGDQSRLEHYAVLLAAARRGCDVFTEEEFRSKFPDLTQPGCSAKNYFLDANGDSPRLGWFIVDHDKLSSRLVNKVRGRVGTILGMDRPVFRRLVLDGYFAVHVLTATDGKRLNLEAAFARKPLRTVPVSIESFPDELSDFFLMKRR
jgi:hypothetical protein